MIVTQIRLRDWNKDDGTLVKVTDVTFDDGSEAPGYDLPPGIEEGKPLPQGWSVATSKAGKPYIKVPKTDGGKTAYRNTKDGMEAEQRSIHASIALQQERSDRRTALMQAVEYTRENPNENPLPLAEGFYNWLRETSGAGSSSSVGGIETPVPGSTSPVSGPEGLEGSSVGEADTGETTSPGVLSDSPGGWVEAVGTPASTLSQLWYDLYDLTGGDKAKARRQVTKANKRTTPCTSSNEDDVTEVELKTAIASLR